MQNQDDTDADLGNYLELICAFAADNVILVYYIVNKRHKNILPFDCILLLLLESCKFHFY